MCQVAGQLKVNQRLVSLPARAPVNCTPVRGWVCHPSTGISQMPRLRVPARSTRACGWNRSSPTIAFGRPLENAFQWAPASGDSKTPDRMYGTNGLSNALVAAQWPGKSLGASPPAHGHDLGIDGRAARNSVHILVCSGPLGKHQSDPPRITGMACGGSAAVRQFTSHWQGRGPAPAGWRPLPEDGNSWFPFNPRNPEGAGRSLAAGDYVIMRGCLWQDQGHGSGPWDAMPTTGHGGWAEIHPPDWIIRTAPPNPNARLTGRLFGLCTDAVTGLELIDEGTIIPDFAPTPSAALQVRSARVEIDPSVTDASTFTTRQISRQEGSITTRFGVTPNGIRQGRAKGAVLVGWSERHARDEVWVDDALPPELPLAPTAGINGSGLPTVKARSVAPSRTFRLRQRVSISITFGALPNLSRPWHLTACSAWCLWTPRNPPTS